MRYNRWPVFVLVLAGALVGSSSLRAGDDEEPKKPAENKEPAKFQTVQIDGQLAETDPPDHKREHPCKLHRVALRKGKAYVIDLTSKQFDTYLRLEDADGNALAEDDDGGEGLNARIKYTPLKDGNYQIVATTFGGGVGIYRLTVRESNEKPLVLKAGKAVEIGPEGLKIGGKLTQDDAKSPVTPTNACKVYSVKMKANVTYVIDLESADFDAYLHVLENKTMRSLASDDDSGGNLNARIMFRPTEDDTYHILATSLNRQLGVFSLRVHMEKE